MRTKSMALIMVAVGCGLVATIGANQVMKENAKTDEVAMGPVAVVVADVDIHSPLTVEGEEAVVRIVERPTDQIPQNAITSLEELDGKYAGVRLYPNEVLFPGKISDSNDSPALRIPPGMRVSAVKVSEDSAVANLIKPGDHVDVIAYIKSQQGSEVRSKTILRNVKVFAVNAETNRGQELGEEGHIDAKTVSLLVKPPQVQMVVLAEQLGTLELSLRNPEETEKDLTDEEATTFQDLLGNTDSKPSADAKEQGWKSLLPKSFTQPTPASPAVEEETFQVQIINGGDQVVTYAWDDENKLPNIVSDTGSKSSLPSLPSATAEGSEPSKGVTDLPPGLIPSPVPPVPSSPFLGDA